MWLNGFGIQQPREVHLWSAYVGKGLGPLRAPLVCSPSHVPRWPVPGTSALPAGLFHLAQVSLPPSSFQVTAGISWLLFLFLFFFVDLSLYFILLGLGG